MASRSLMLRFEAAHACMETELAPSVLDRVVASLTQIEVPTHWLSIGSSELEAREFVWDLCWLTVIEARLLQWLPS